MTATPGSIRTTVAILVVRVLIPLWLGVGAVLKMIDGSPSNLPVALVTWLGGNGLDLRFVLEFSIAVELVAVCVMVLIPRLARLVGIVMLASFVPVLIGDVALGASSCGCFGAVAVSPWITLATDVFFLFCLVFVAHGVPALRLAAELPTWRVLAAGAGAVACVALAFGVTASTKGSVTLERTVGTASAVPDQGFYLPDYDSWLGEEFGELDIASWITGLPDDLDRGQHFVLFYRKDCEHCHELMEVFFSQQAPLPTTAVAVPDRDGYPTVGVQPFVCEGCRLAELPAGVDWFMKTPVLVRIGEGVVECAAEVDAENPLCLDVF
jgi:hypothetical protein